MEERDFLILFQVFNDYIEKFPINNLIWSTKAARETFTINACQAIALELSKTDIDKNSDYYINSNLYVKELIESQLNSDKITKSQEMQKRERSEAIKKEDEIFKKKMASLNK